MLYGLVHSALASARAKEGAARLLGRRQRNGLYRLWYLGQSVGTFAALLLYARRQPDRPLYEVRGPWAWPLRVGQVLALGYAVAAAQAVGLRQILGVTSLLAWLRRGPSPRASDGPIATTTGEVTVEVPAEPEAQGPALRADGRLRVTGPFAWSRHPLNLAPVPVF